MPLHLDLRTKSSVPLEVDGILPSSIRGKSLAAVEQLKIFAGNQQAGLADFFRVSGDTNADQLVWQGDLSGVHWIGAKLESGRVDVQGNVGRHVGSEMTGGEIHVQGNASDWLGGQMRGGLIHVRGSAGDLVGAAYRGSTKGMRQGTILVHGNAGNEIGHSMRRGMLAIAGNVGDLAGINMLAGSIFVFGSGGIRHGAGMKRGTIGFFGTQRPPLLPTFRPACRYRPDVLPLAFRHLQKLGFPVQPALFDCDFDLYNGDFLAGGRGEILLVAN